MTKILLLSLLLFPALYAKINLIKKENNDSNTTLLVIGGIHGNEPGGYYAPAILASRYKILSKNLWVIPNLNQESIMANRRGIHGDMNRKFAAIKKGDKDKKIVQEIKKIILSPKVSLILNLHDGHGFYRKNSQGRIYNPRAWGQTCVIDQCQIPQNTPYFNLNEIAEEVKNNINKKLLKKHHSFNVKNTHTKRDHYKDMQQSLTYFAIQHSKPAFAIETSKRLSSTAQKVFYQLVAIEEYMKIMDINFTRDFDLNEAGIQKIINNYGTLEINGNILLDLSNIKKSLSYIPIKSNGNEFKFSNPLGMVKKSRGRYLVYIGNKRITSLKPQYFKISKHCASEYKVYIDGNETKVKSASDFYVNDDFKVLTSKSCRLNVIGFSKKGVRDESGHLVTLKDLNSRYSIDRSKKSYRLEFYNKDKFCSMLVVHFK